MCLQVQNKVGVGQIVRKLEARHGLQLKDLSASAVGNTHALEQSRWLGWVITAQDQQQSAERCGPEEIRGEISSSR